MLRIIALLLLIPSISLAASSQPVTPEPETKPAIGKDNLPVPGSTRAGDSYPEPDRRAFLQSCVGMYKEMIPACRCMLIGLQSAIPFDEFVVMTQKGDPQRDARFTSIANRCINAK